MPTTVDASIPLGIKPPTMQDAMANMSSLLGVQKARQDLQTGQETLAQNQVKTQQDQNTLREQQALGQLNPRDYVDPATGIIDADRYMKDAMAATPITGIGAARATAIYQAQKAQTDVNKAGQDLNRDIRGDVASRFAALSGDPKSTFNDYVKTAEAIKKDNPQAGKLVDSYIAQLDPNGDIKTTHLKASTLNRAVLPVSENQPKPSSVDAGASIQPGVTDPRTGEFTPAGKPITKGIPPGFELTEDPVTHNKFLWNRQTGESRAFGAGAPASGARTPATGMSGAPAVANAPPQRQIGEAAAQEAQVDTNFKNHQNNINAASSANQQRDQIHRAAQLLDEGVKTGKGAETLNSIESLLSKVPGLDGLAGAGSQAAKHDLLNKFLERIGADYGSLNGSPAKTDAGAESLRSQIGSTAYNPEALRDVLKYTDAQYAAAQAKQRGEQRFLATPGNGIRNQHDYETQWRNSYDPRLFQLDNMKPEEAAAELKKMSPADRAALLKKHDELKALGAM